MVPIRPFAVRNEHHQEQSRASQGQSRPSQVRSLASAIFLQFSSRNSVRWKYGLDYTLTNGVGKQGKTDRPHASKRPGPEFLEKNSRKSVQLGGFANCRRPPKLALTASGLNPKTSSTAPTSAQGEATTELRLRRVFHPFVSPRHLPHSRQASGPCQCTTGKTVHRKPL
jgi:hypothetical protein